MSKKRIPTSPKGRSRQNMKSLEAIKELVNGPTSARPKTPTREITKEAPKKANKQVVKETAKEVKKEKIQETKKETLNMDGFADLTCNRYSELESLQHTSSTHDFAEDMIYSFVDNSPHVADLLWAKQQLGQNAFLTLAAEADHDQDHQITHSTHQIAV
ncbi:hypothetical protein BY458DRAFT_504992 [Sporodiniella umbellata]|nr:hypothetical protein BY458DRAFT_504992 [Sporodiniella umbellata]